METPTTDELVDLRITERDKVEAWRLHILIATGYPVATAERLAAATGVDLHRAVALFAAGCTPELAVAILL